ncbi:MAG: response regulator transcription factor [Calditrichaeota bacterium]|nr:response regulator transcription factor [Calditrichota bacterium]
MINVAIIEDDEQLRENLILLINSESEFTCVGGYPDCEKAIQSFSKKTPDVVLMDIELPGMSGIEGVNVIKHKYPQAEIIMLTIHEDNESVFDSLSNGASGYLVKNTEPLDLINCIKEVFMGGAPMSMNIARMIIDSFHKHPPEEALTHRESEVLHKLRKGKSYKAIANELFISKSTVKFHIKNIYRKLHVLNKTQAIIKHFHHGLNE